MRRYFFQTVFGADKIWVCAEASPNLLENFVSKTRGFTSCRFCRNFVERIRAGHSDDAASGCTNRRKTAKRRLVEIRSLERNRALVLWSPPRSEPRHHLA
jgi:hypothetical protein